MLVKLSFLVSRFVYGVARLDFVSLDKSDVVTRSHPTRAHTESIQFGEEGDRRNEQGRTTLDHFLVKPVSSLDSAR